MDPVLVELFVSALATFFVVIDPPGCAPIFASITTEATPQQRRAMAIRAVFVATLILIFFALVGEKMLGALGISLDAFRISGGIMLFYIAFDMIFERRTKRREDRAQKIIETPEVEDVSIFPMAMPMIAGPGSIAAVMLMETESRGIEASLVVFAALGVILLVTLVALIAAGGLMRLLGKRTEAVLTRLLGVILAALAAQFVIDGLQAAFNLG